MAGHLRSISLPSKNHPLIANIEEQLARLRASEATFCLSSLKGLYESVDDLLQLPVTQQALSNEHHQKPLDQTLDGSLRFLDICSTTRDVYAQMKECVQGLQSSLRRKRGVESSLQNDVHAYMISRKKMNKVISKCLGDLKRTEKTCTTSLDMEPDMDVVSAVNILKEVEEINLNVFKSILYFLSRPQSRSPGWSVVSRLLKSKVSSNEKANEVEKIEAQLLALISKKSCIAEMQNVLKGLEALESDIQEVEEELECVYRRLMKTRVSLLNLLNH